MPHGSEEIQRDTFSFHTPFSAVPSPKWSHSFTTGPTFSGHIFPVWLYWKRMKNRHERQYLDIRLDVPDQPTPRHTHTHTLLVSSLPFGKKIPPSNTGKQCEAGVLFSRPLQNRKTIFIIWIHLLFWYFLHTFAHCEEPVLKSVFVMTLGSHQQHK